MFGAPYTPYRHPDWALLTRVPSETRTVHFGQFANGELFGRNRHALGANNFLVEVAGFWHSMTPWGSVDTPKMTRNIHVEARGPAQSFHTKTLGVRGAPEYTRCNVASLHRARARGKFFLT